MMLDVVTCLFVEVAVVVVFCMFEVVVFVGLAGVLTFRFLNNPPLVEFVVALGGGGL